MNNLPDDPTPAEMNAAPQQHAGGAILFRATHPGWEFLLLRYADRWDLPKGRVEPGESAWDAAQRELWEETSIDPATVRWAPDFHFSHRYSFIDRSGTPVLKELTIYLGVVSGSPNIHLTEHIGFQWFPWHPPHQIETKNVDRVLQAVAAFGGPPADRLIDL